MDVSPLAGPDCLHARVCPISEGPCPGECVFADVMRSANLGILVFDVEEERLLFANREARGLLQTAGVEIGYRTAREVFQLSAVEEGSAQPRNQARRLGARLVGFTAYRNRAIEWIFFRDISDRARLEAVAEAIELTNSLGHVFAAVRHEIGNPINSAKMALSVLRRNFDDLGRKVAIEYIDEVLGELSRVGDLLTSLKSFSLYEDVHPLDLDLDEFLGEFADFACRDFRGEGIRLRLRAGAPGVRVHADPRALRQVLMNLVANAADAMEQQDGGEIQLGSAVTDNVVVVEVRDNGPGIRADALEHLFEPFFTTKPGGTGLGLPIARKMLARMSATISIESPPGTGTCVLITLRRSAA